MSIEQPNGGKEEARVRTDHHFGASLVCILGLVPFVCSADPEAFVLQGQFESVFGGKHLDQGMFSVHAYRRKALVELVHENSYREIVGTDDNNSYVFTPYSGPSSNVNQEAIASIGSGRFPADAHIFAKILWLLSTHDEEVVAQAMQDALFFYGDYRPDEITWATEVAKGPPRLITSISWYATNALASGTNRYALAEYPEGWLIADVRVTQTRAVNGLTLPDRIQFSQKATLATLPSSDPLRRNRDDVRAVGEVLFVVTNAQVEPLLASYVPEVVCESVRVHDKRFDIVARVKSGKWWMVGERLQDLQANSGNRRFLVVLLLMSMSALLAIFGAIVLKRSRKETKNNNER